jgi:hypothetical protein
MVGAGPVGAKPPLTGNAIVADGKSARIGLVFEKVWVGAGPVGSVSSTGSARGGVGCVGERLTGNDIVAAGLSLRAVAGAE